MPRNFWQTALGLWIILMVTAPDAGAGMGASLVYFVAVACAVWIGKRGK